MKLPSDDDEQDVNQTEWGADLDHCTIDDDPIVLAFMGTMLEANVDR